MRKTARSSHYTLEHENGTILLYIDRNHEINGYFHSIEYYSLLCFCCWGCFCTLWNIEKLKTDGNTTEFWYRIIESVVFFSLCNLSFEWFPGRAIYLIRDALKITWLVLNQKNSLSFMSNEANIVLVTECSSLKI